MGLAPLRQRDFGLLWWAGLISLIGNWALGIALPIHVLCYVTDSRNRIATRAIWSIRAFSRASTATASSTVRHSATR